MSDMHLVALFEVQKPKSFLLLDNTVPGMLCFCLEAGKMLITRPKSRTARGVDKLLTTG